MTPKFEKLLAETTKSQLHEKNWKYETAKWLGKKTGLGDKLEKGLERYHRWTRKKGHLPSDLTKGGKPKKIPGSSPAKPRPMRNPSPNVKPTKKVGPMGDKVPNPTYIKPQQLDQLKRNWKGHLTRPGVVGAEVAVPILGPTVYDWVAPGKASAKSKPPVDGIDMPGGDDNKTDVPSIDTLDAGEGNKTAPQLGGGSNQTATPKTPPVPPSKWLDIKMPGEK